MIYDDEHTETAVFDAAGVQAWSLPSAVYDAGGQLVATPVAWRDGHVDSSHI